jgi:hypothetical protein
MTGIFENGKNQELYNLIQENPTTSYKVVDEYLSANPRFKKGYFAWRRKQELPYAQKNNIIWELVSMAQDSGAEFEV